VVGTGRFRRATRRAHIQQFASVPRSQGRLKYLHPTERGGYGKNGNRKVAEPGGDKRARGVDLLRKETGSRDTGESFTEIRFFGRRLPAIRRKFLRNGPRKLLGETGRGEAAGSIKAPGLLWNEVPRGQPQISRRCGPREGPPAGGSVLPLCFLSPTGNLPRHVRGSWST